MEKNKYPLKVEQSLQRINGLAKGLLSEDYRIGYQEGVDALMEDYAALRARCEKMEQALKVARWGLKNSYDVTEHPANGQSFQDNAIRFIEATLKQENINPKEWESLLIEPLKEEKEPVPQGPATTVLVPCSEDDPRAVGGYTSYDGRSLCHVRESEVPVIEGAVWVKASQFKFEVGIAYHAKDSKSKGAGHFDDFGNFFWNDHNMTPGDSQDDLLILDEQAGKEPCQPSGTCQGENGTCIDWYACERNNGCKWPVKEVKL